MSRGEAPSGRSEVSRHILPTSATMVGVCITVVSIVRLMEVSGNVSTTIDNLMSIDSVVFLASTVLSYLSLRRVGSTPRLERAADLVFLAGLVLMVAVGCTFA